VSAPAISVVIPTKNGAATLREVLASLTVQEVAPSEVIIVDSGSRDATVDIARADSGAMPVRIESIPPASFNHGETRNLGASYASGDLLVFLTQDATPGDPGWLRALTAPFADPQVAGVYGAHRPRPSCHPMEARQILEFELIAGAARRVNTAAAPDFHENPWPYIYFSNSNSCLRRSVWERIRFRRLSFAEDQDWARRALLAGHATVFAPDAVVVHSHSYGARECFRRCYDHAKGMQELFGRPELPRLRSVLPRVTRDVRADYRWLRRSAAPRRAALGWMPASLAWHAAQYVGLWVGTHHTRMPRKASDYLSLQTQIMRGWRRS
jgi:rhamnosyltransferase